MNTPNASGLPKGLLPGRLMDKIRLNDLGIRTETDYAE